MGPDYSGLFFFSAFTNIITWLQKFIAIFTPVRFPGLSLHQFFITYQERLRDVAR
jgi:hypothetical protein